MPSQMTSPLRRRLERIYPGQNNNSINTYRIISHSNENEIDEYDEIYEPVTRHDRAAQQQPLRERPQNVINLPRHGRPLSGILGSSNTAAGQNTRRSVRLAASVTKSTPAQPLHQAGAVSSPPMVPKAAQHGSLYDPLDHVEEKEEEEEEEEEDQIVVVPRKRMRDARKIILDPDDEENGEDKDVEGEVSPPIRVARPPKRRRCRSKAVVSDSEGDTGPHRSNRVTNKTLDPQDVTIFEDDLYAEEQTDEEEYESGLEMKEQGINQGHHTTNPKTTFRRSKRPGTGKPRKPNFPHAPDNFARLHLGSTSILFCLQDTSTQRRSLWASRLCACLKSYQDQCRDTYQRLGDYNEAMEVLGNQQTGPLAKTVASVLLRHNLDVEKVVQQELLPRYSQAVTDILGLETVTVETLLQLPRLSDEDLYTPGDYVKLIDLNGWQQYWGSATGMFGTVKRWYDYDSMILNGNTREGPHCGQMLAPGAKVHVRAVATGFAEESKIWAVINEGLLMTIFGSVENEDKRDGWANAKVFDFVQQARMDMGKLAITLKQVPGLNRTSSLKQGVRFKGRIPPCSNCAYDIQPNENHFWQQGIPYTRCLCRRCYRYSQKHPGENRPFEYEGRRVELQELRSNKPADTACKGNCGTNGQKWGFISDLWICSSCFDFEKRTTLPITSPEGLENCAIRAAARPAFGAPVNQRAVRDVGKSKRSSDNKCQANNCDAQAVQRGKVSGLFLCQQCRDYENIHGFSINSAERAAYLQKKEQKARTRPKDGLCEAIHCETKHGKRGSISKLYLCGSCIGYEYTRKHSINSVEGIEWQEQRNEKRLSKLGH
jgi:hypothetical protein